MPCVREWIGGDSHMNDIDVAIGVDADCVAGWLGSYGGADSPADLSRGLSAGNEGIPRMLQLFED